MAIFNKEYTLSLLNEMKSKEEYSRRSFKKKYKFEPSEYNKDIGKIKVDGKEYRIDMRNTKYKDEYYQNKKHNKDINKLLKDNNFMPSKEDPNIGTITYKNGKSVIVNKKDSLKDTTKNKYKKFTYANISSSNGDIILSKDFFKKKGSNHNERRDATLQHEIGHHRTLNPNYINGKDKDKISDTSEYSRKYEKGEHAMPEEFLADRYAANKTSEKAVKRSIRNAYKINGGDKKANQEDYTQRSKALKDSKMRKFNIED